MKRFFRFLPGYIIGFSVFVLLIPYGIYSLSAFDPIININLNEFLLIRIMAAAPFLVIGLFFMIWSNLSLVLTGKGGPAEGFGVAISPRTKVLVTTGPYRYCRNPMVFGALSFYLSIAVFHFSIMGIGALLIMRWLIVHYIIRSEEKRLEEEFGKAFIDYCRKTNVLVPWWQRNKG